MDFEPREEISRQLEEMLANIEVRNLQEVHDLVEEDINLLLNSIKAKSGSKDNLMDYVQRMAAKQGLSSPADIYNLKVKVLLDNLAKKMCRCVGQLKKAPLAKGNQQIYSKEAVCRRTIFQNRGIDFYTFECEQPNVGPRLNPKKGSKSILHKYTKPQKGGKL